MIGAKESLKDCLFNNLKFVILLTKTRWLQTKLSGEIVVEIKSFKKEPAQRAGVLILLDQDGCNRMARVPNKLGNVQCT